MVSAPAASSWLVHPQAEALLRFNLLPTLWLHASRMGSLLPAGLAAMFEEAGALGRLHRHWSAELVREMGLAPATDLSDPALPLALLDGPALERLVSACGLVLLGPAIRKTIARSEVHLLEQQLGAQALRFARFDASQLHVSGDAPALEPGRAAEQALLAGGALLAAAFECASEPVARRGLLRLPEEAAQERLRLPVPFSQSRQALKLARSVLDMQDPIWLSSFPVSR